MTAGICPLGWRLLLIPGPERVQRIVELCDVTKDFELLEPPEHPARLVA